MKEYREKSFNIEDLDNDKSLDTTNDYFTYSLNFFNAPNLENHTYI